MWKRHRRPKHMIIFSKMCTMIYLTAIPSCNFQVFNLQRFSTALPLPLPFSSTFRLHLKRTLRMYPIDNFQGWSSASPGGIGGTGHCQKTAHRHSPCPPPPPPELYTMFPLFHTLCVFLFFFFFFFCLQLSGQCQKTQTAGTVSGDAKVWWLWLSWSMNFCTSHLSLYLSIYLAVILQTCG